MSTTSTHTSATSAAPSNAGSLVPFTETFIQTSGSSTITTAIALVGQVLDNAQTNFVGYDNGSAEYLYTTSHAGASETTLAGSTYYVSEGAAPAGYLATVGSGSGANQTAAGGASASSGYTGSAASTATGAGVVSTTTNARSSGTSATTAAAGSSSKTSSASASSTSSSGSVRVSAGMVFTVAIGLTAVLVNVVA